MARRTPSADPGFELPSAPLLEPEVLEGISVPPRSPTVAAVRSGLLIGWGQLYNKQLEKAVLLWIWCGVLVGLGLLLLVLGCLGAVLTAPRIRPPLGDFIATHSLAVLAGWMALAFGLWAVGIRDAHQSAEEINAGKVIIRYPMRRQLAHVAGSQLLGFIPLVGFVLGPGVVAEALDAARDRRRPDHRRLVREGAQSFAEWVAVRVAVYALIGAAGAWVLWWLLRIVGLPV